MTNSININGWGSYVVSLSPASGIFTHCNYDPTSKQINLAPVSRGDSYLLGNWQQSGTIFTANGDKVIANNTDGGDYFIWNTYDWNGTIPSNIIFRVTASAVNLLGTGDSNDFGIECRVTYQVDPVTGIQPPDESISIGFPPGTWNEQQFSVEISPNHPVHWVYFYVFTRNVTGQVTLSNAEILSYGTGDQLTDFGSWESSVIDVYQVMNVPIDVGTMSMKKVAFLYGSLSDIDHYGSVSYSIAKLSKFDIAVISPYDILTGREPQVVAGAVANGVKLFGYVHIGKDGGVYMDDTTFHNHALACAQNGYWGMFLDEAGYDWQVSRDRLNSWVDYCHSLGLDVFTNAWVPADNLSSAVDATWNPNGTPTHLGQNKFVQLNFDTNISTYVKNSTYTVSINSGYHSTFDMIKNKLTLGVDYITDDSGGKFATILAVNGYQLTIRAEQNFTDYSPSGWNGDGISMKANDWTLLESFYGRGDNTYVSDMGSAISKYTTTVSLAQPLGVNVACLTYKVDTSDIKTAIADKEMSFLLALMCGVNGWAYGSTTLSTPDQPSLTIGSTFTGPLVTVGTNTWERPTDQGVVLYSRGDTPSDNSWSNFKTSIAPVLSQDDVTTYFPNVEISNITYYTSSDGNTWNEWTGSPSRYCKVIVEFYSY
jgi:hypothetical protein